MGIDKDASQVQVGSTENVRLDARLCWNDKSSGRYAGKGGTSERTWWLGNYRHVESNMHQDV